MSIGRRSLLAQFAAASLALGLRGCILPPIGYQPGARMTEVDPATGDTVITQYWVYDDGVSAVTFKRIPRGNTDRRREAPPPPQARFRD
jgi:hypothetical protein